MTVEELLEEKLRKLRQAREANQRAWDEIHRLREELKRAEQRHQAELAKQTKYNITSRRSLCEQSDRYKAERDTANEMLIKVSAQAVAWERGYDIDEMMCGQRLSFLLGVRDTDPTA